MQKKLGKMVAAFKNEDPTFARTRKVDFHNDELDNANDQQTTGTSLVSDDDNGD